MEVELMDTGLQYIGRVSEQLQSLPKVVTKEELINYYLHKMRAKGAVDLNVTVVNLVQAANLANIKVRGKSKLEVNVPIMEQWKYISDNIKTTLGKLSRKEVRKKLYANKDDIIATYESGTTIKELAFAWNVNSTTMHKYLHEFGVEVRKAGKKKIYNGTETIVQNGMCGYGKKRSREQNSEKYVR